MEFPCVVEKKLYQRFVSSIENNKKKTLQICGAKCEKSVGKSRFKKASCRYYTPISQLIPTICSSNTGNTPIYCL